MSSVQDQEKIFNLQLVIQKLEEELTLYRNGTSGQELLEYISEKDAEIEECKKLLAEKGENLRKIAKSSNELLSKYESLDRECVELRKRVVYLEEICDSKELTIKNTEKTIEDKNNKIADLEQQICTLDKNVDILTAEISERNDNIEKLQQRCAGLVSEKTEKSKLLEKEKVEKARQVKELRVKLELFAIIYNLNLNYL